MIYLHFDHPTDVVIVSPGGTIALLTLLNDLMRDSSPQSISHDFSVFQIKQVFVRF
jgi:hypothetical protein